MAFCVEEVLPARAHLRLEMFFPTRCPPLHPSLSLSAFALHGCVCLEAPRSLNCSMKQYLFGYSVPGGCAAAVCGCMGGSPAPQRRCCSARSPAPRRGAAACAHPSTEPPSLSRDLQRSASGAGRAQLRGLAASSRRNFSIPAGGHHAIAIAIPISGWSVHFHCSAAPLPSCVNTPPYFAPLQPVGDLPGA